MKKIFHKSLFIFRRDLRLDDNTGLIFALKSSESVIPIFILTPEQIDHNPYRSNHCLKFMFECIQDLQNQIEKIGGKLFLFKGKSDEVLRNCIKDLKVDAVIVNRDYTPYSIQRDARLESVCKSEKIPFYSFHDALLLPPEDTLKKDGTPYTVFTPYFLNASKQEISSPIKNKWTNYFLAQIPSGDVTLPKIEINNRLKGGRKEALKVLNGLNKFKAYSEARNFPSFEGTTLLSAYLKFTVCSPREVYAKIQNQLGHNHDLIRSLHWRDFFTKIAFFFPYVFQGCFHSKYDQIKWSNDKHMFAKWCEGKTGFPIVDAGMRELNQTGYMHNRVRMIAASFLVKDLLIDWRWGEKYFAQTLIDYDPAVNNGNWQWVASTGCDSQPYFRIFNPWNQQKKFDPDCIYIKHWISELNDLQPKIIHSWDESYLGLTQYPKPILSHEIAAKKALNAYSLQ